VHEKAHGAGVHDPEIVFSLVAEAVPSQEAQRPVLNFFELPEPPADVFVPGPEVRDLHLYEASAEFALLLQMTFFQGGNDLSEDEESEQGEEGRHGKHGERECAQKEMSPRRRAGCGGALGVAGFVGVGGERGRERILDGHDGSPLPARLFCEKTESCLPWSS
jgi:hypothetical protein